MIGAGLTYEAAVPVVLAAAARAGRERMPLGGLIEGRAIEALEPASLQPAGWSMDPRSLAELAPTGWAYQLPSWAELGRSSVPVVGAPAQWTRRFRAEDIDAWLGDAHMELLRALEALYEGAVFPAGVVPAGEQQAARELLKLGVAPRMVPGRGGAWDDAAAAMAPMFTAWAAAQWDTARRQAEAAARRLAAVEWVASVAAAARDPLRALAPRVPWWVWLLLAAPVLASVAPVMIKGGRRG